MARGLVYRIFAIAFTALCLEGSVTLASAQCNLAAVDKTKAELIRLTTLQRASPLTVSRTMVADASRAYVSQAEACFDQLYGRPGETIDAGGLLVDEGVDHYSLVGRKWGVTNSFSASGSDNTGPRSPGGIVTYSYMANGVTMAGDVATAPGTNVSISSLPGFSACFLTEIEAAFAAWSAVANIQFVRVTDNGAAFNSAGAMGEIRIGAHTFDGPSHTLAHSYYPPPNGFSAAGDMHFDREETWGCAASPGVIDIGIVALHEIGHSLGLAHETRSGRRAVMNPSYNPSVASLLLGDDIDGGINIYGSAMGVSDDLLVNFAAGGVWRLNYGVAWTLIHPQTAEDVVVADVDGNGVDDLAVDFGLSGLWLLRNNRTWAFVHPHSPAMMVAGDLDGDGRDDLVFDFPGLGVWGYYNDATTWGPIHPLSPRLMVAGDVDGSGTDDVTFSYAEFGVWSYLDNATWSLVHPTPASVMASGHMSAAAGAEDLLLGFEGYGLYKVKNGAWTLLTGFLPERISVGDLDPDGRDDAILDLGPGIGLYIFRNDTRWSFLHPLPCRSMTLGDLDGNGRDEIVVDFPSLGTWAWVNDQTWIAIHTNPPGSRLNIVDVE